MTGDTQHVYAIKDSDTDPKLQQKDGGFEHFSEKDRRKLNSGNTSGPESCKTVLNGNSLNHSHLHRKNKDSHNQREAVIRPQQAGRIDFKSLQSKPRFLSEHTWSSSNSSSCKSTSQSPYGKNKGKEKNKRYGKGPHHLYKLNINSRSNPTIGIAYPQQKITSAKKLEGKRELITGSYRFNVPSIPEREAELQQEDLSYSRHYQEDPASHTSTSYTSNTTVVANQNQGSKTHSQGNVNISRDNANFNGKLQYPEFHGSRNNSNISPFSVDWHSPDKPFAGTNYGMSPQKQSTFPLVAESSKSNTQGFRSIPFPYPLPQLHDVPADPFNSEHSGQCHFQQEFSDVPLPNAQVAHSGYVFQLTGDGHEDSVRNGQCGTSSDGRSYTHSSHQTQFLRPSNQGTPHRVSHYKGNHPNDMNGAISSNGALPSSGAVSSNGAVSSVGANDQNQSTFQENQTVCTSDAFNLHNNGIGYVSMNKKCSPLKGDRGTERTDSQGKSLRRNITQGSLPQMHFQDKVYDSPSNNSVPDGLVSFDKNISNKIHSQPRLPQAWEGNKMFSTKDYNTAPYTSVANQFSYPCQSVSNLSHADQKQPAPRNGNSRLPWQQIHLTSAMPNQNRIELSRQLTSQQLAFPLGASEWQECKKAQRNPPVCKPVTFRNKRQVNSEELQNSRNSGNGQNCNTTDAFAFRNGLDNTSTSLCDSRNPNRFCDLNPVVPASARGSGHGSLTIAKSISGSPYQSPQSSPTLNTGSTSTCSSLSPVSTVYSANSPLNTNSEESHMPTLTSASRFYHQHCHSKEDKRFPSSEHISANLLHQHHDPTRGFAYFSTDHSRGTKDNLLYIQDNSFSQQTAKINGCADDFETESQPFPEQFFANSLSSANLDQLDVLLTCKQCDQNFNNVASFLDHRQYCGIHSGSHTEQQDPTRATESRRLHAESAKGTGLHSTRGGSDPHQSLLCLSKSCDLLLDGEAASDPKDDPFKLNIFSGAGSGSVLLTASDLEIDDAKLDSLINETLNGLDYQSDNAEIDSSFIEAFADDELSTTKIAGNGMAFKMKDCMPLGSKAVSKLAEAEDDQSIQIKTVYNNRQSDRHTQRKEKSRHHNRKIEKKDSTTSVLSKSYCRRVDKYSIKKCSHESSFDSLKYTKPSTKLMKLKGGRKLDTDAALHRRISEVLSQPAQNVRKKCERDKHKNNGDIRDTIHSTPLKIVTVNSHSKLHRPALRDIKKRKSSNRTWSKELIHKIVQQKNKLHKLHVKSNKKLHVSLVNEQLLSHQRSGKLGEYDYVSDSDQEAEPPGSKYLTPCLNQLANYSITREHKTKCGRVEAEESWRYIKIKKTPERSIGIEGRNRAKRYHSSRLRRRRSQSSTSSEYSNITSSSSENTNSPNSVERTDSDNEKGKNTIESKHSTFISITDRTYKAECIGPDPLIDESARTSKDSSMNQAVFSRTTKEFGSAKCLFSGRGSQSTSHTMTHLYDHGGSHKMEIEEQCIVRSNPSHVELSYNEKRPQACESFEKDLATTSNESIAPNTELTFDQRDIQKCSSCEDGIVEYSTAGINQNNLTHTTELTADMKDELADASNKMKDSLVGSTGAYKTNVGCFHDNSSAFNIQVYDDAAQNTMDRMYSGHKDLEKQHAVAFSESLARSSSHLEDIFFCQNESSDNYLQKDHIKRFINAYPSEKCPAKMKSPVSFHTPGIFGDIPISNFNSQLYTDTLVNKENYYPFSCNGDKEGGGAAFQLQYPSFLEQKDWNLLPDMSTILPEDITHFQDLSVQSAQIKKFSPTTGSSPVTTPPLLPERLDDQNGPFVVPLSDDDLEIKRLVTELENQLQAPQRNNETPVAQAGTGEYMNASLKNQTSPPSSLCLEQDKCDRQTVHAPNHPFSNGNMYMHCKGTVLNSPKVERPSSVGIIEDTEDMWTCPFQLVPLDDFQTPDKVHANPRSPDKDNQSHYPIHPEEPGNRKDDEPKRSAEEESGVSPGSYSEKTEEKLENQYYTENLIANLAIMSDTVLGKSSLQQSTDGEQECQTVSEGKSSSGSTDHEKPFNLSPQYRSTECHVAEKQSEPECEAVLFSFENPAASPCVDTVACDTENDFSVTAVDHSQEEQYVNHQQQNTSDNQSSGKSVISAFLSESEETDQSLIITNQITTSDRSPETKYKERINDTISSSYVGISPTEQHSSVKIAPDSNPLQQLQLFVARTAQCNEELMMISCYAAPHIPTNHSLNGSINSERSEAVLNTAHNVDSTINPMDNILQSIGTNKCQIVDVDANTSAQNILPKVSKDIAETVAENTEDTSGAWEPVDCSRSDNSEEQSEISVQILTSQIPLTNHLKKAPHSQEGVIDSSEFEGNPCSLFSLNGTNVNPPTLEEKDLIQIADHSQNSTQNSVPFFFNHQEKAEEMALDIFSDGDETEKATKQCLNAFEETLEPEQSNCPLSQSFPSTETSCDVEPPVEHLTVNDMAQSEASSDIAHPVPTLECHVGTSDESSVIDENVNTSRNDHSPEHGCFRQSPEMATVTSCTESISEKQSLSIADNYSNISPAPIDKSDQQEPSNSSKDDVIPKSDGCKESLLFLHLDFDSQDAERGALGCIAKPQENVTEHDLEYKVPETQIHDGHSALKTNSGAENIADILLSKINEELPTNITTNGNAAKDSNEDTDDSEHWSFLGKDMKGSDHRSFDQTTSLLTDMPICMEAKSNDCTLSETLTKSPTSHLVGGAGLEMSHSSAPSNDSGGVVEAEHSKCNYAEVLGSNFHENVPPSLQGHLLELPPSPQHVSDLNLHSSPLVDSVPMETLNKHSNTDNSNRPTKRKSSIETNAQIGFLTVEEKPEENVHISLQDEVLSNGTKQMDSNLFIDCNDGIINAQTLAIDNAFCPLSTEQQNGEVTPIANNHGQLNDCSDEKIVNQITKVSKEFGGESESRDNADLDSSSSLPMTEPHSSEKVESESGEKDGANSDDVVLSSLMLAKTLNDLHGSEQLDLAANNLLPENISMTDPQKLIEPSTPQTEQNLQTVIMCNVCSASFRSKQGLVRHKAIKHRLKGEKTSQNKVNRILACSIPATEPNTEWQQDTENTLFSASEKKTHMDIHSLDTPVSQETIQTDHHLFLCDDKHSEESNSTLAQNEIGFHCKENQHLKEVIDTNEIHDGHTKEDAKPSVMPSEQDMGTMACNEQIEANKSAKLGISKSKKTIECSKEDTKKQTSNSINSKDIVRQYRKKNPNAPTPAKEKNRNVGKDEQELVFNGEIVQSSKQVGVIYGKIDEPCPLLELQVVTAPRDSPIHQQQMENSLSTSKSINMCITPKEWTSRQKSSNDKTIVVEEKVCNLINVSLKEDSCKKECNGELECQIDFPSKCSSNEGSQNTKPIKIEEGTSEKAVGLLQKTIACQHPVFSNPVPNLLNGSPLKIPEMDSQTVGDLKNDDSFEKLQKHAPSKPWNESDSIDLELPVLEVIAPNSDSQHFPTMDSAISQIFSEDNSVVRKRSPRVYGNRSKKCKLDTESSTFKMFSSGFVVENSAQVVRSYNDHLITDDTIMSHTSNDSKAVTNKNTSVCGEVTSSRDVARECSSEDVLEGSGMSENTNNNIMELLYQNCKIESMTDTVPNATVWSNPPEVVDISAHGDTTSFESTSEKTMNSRQHAPNIQPQLEATESSQPIEPFEGLASGQCMLRSINVGDVQALNQGYEHPDGDPHNSPGNKSSILNVAHGTSEEKSQNLKFSKGRMEEGRTVKNRGDISIKSKDKQYKCKVCFQWFLTLGELDFHKLSHNPSPPPTCYMCVQRKFSSREQLRDHLKEKHAKNKAGIWTCGMCLKEISDVWMYNEHLREHATQFARKGQAQKSVIGLSNCFSEDSAMKNFFHTLLNKKHGKSKTVDSVAKSLIKETKVLKENQKQTGKNKDQSEASIKTKLNFTSALKLSASANPELMHKTEPIQKNVSMHPDCKDPSRDCHHCGKQFPKPFKLQRHLVVHSLQKIYLCYKCPIFYLEMQELRAHLKGEHLVIEEPEVKHTTLYTCELCADVMHVIKKSFICSTCNYTFSKKEQYDRHMEKHLEGGSKTHKFRGVMRPYVPLQDGHLDPQSNLTQSYSSASIPPNKKQKTNHNGLTEVNTENNIPAISSIGFDHSVCEGPPEFSPVEVNDKTEKMNVLTPTRTDVVDDFSELLVELEQSQPNIADSPPCLSPVVSLPLCHELHLVDLAAPPMPEVHNQLYGGVAAPLSPVNACAFKPHDNVQPSNHSAKEKIKQEEPYDNSKQTNDLQKIPCNSHFKMAAAEKAKQSLGEYKPSEKLAKDSEPKINQKKRKEQKSACVKNSNSYKLTVDEGNKKRKQVKTECVRKSCMQQDNQSTATTRDEPTGSHLASRTKPWTNNSQCKKNVMNFCPLKQPDMRPFIGEYKHKKELISKPPLYSKGGAQSVNSSIRKHRLMQGVKPVESNSYRTAESQSNLLSQLFGQKLTSFKIPLRKDALE